MRSATAHKIFETDPRFKVKSAGTDKSASTVITPELVLWADTIVVMEKSHRDFIRKKYPQVYESKKIVCLYIPDEYEYTSRVIFTFLSQQVYSYPSNIKRSKLKL
jgi:predicted protein tyrosine phosphatase